MNRREESAEKINRVRDWLSGHESAGVLFTTQNNFSWITAGGEAYVSLGEEGAVGSVLVTRDRVVLLTNAIERRRLLEEELSEVDIEVVSWPWHRPKGMVDAASRFADPSQIIVDQSGLEPFAYEKGPMELRWVLLPSEIDRYRKLGRDAAQVVESVCRDGKRGQTEQEIAGLVAQRCLASGILPLVVLIAGDERLSSYRHPIPTTKKINKMGMVVLTGRRKGLHVSLTRLFSFGSVEEITRLRHRAVAMIDAAYILGSRPGRALKEVLADGIGSYEAAGFPQEWELHHQGGLTGYAGRELFATPSTAYRLRENQCAAWNPSITGSKSEDTILVTEDGPEIISQTGEWPMVEIECKGRRIFRPEILER